MKRVLLAAAVFSLMGCNEDGGYIKVYKADGSVQCGREGVAPEVMAQALSAGGIDVICAQKGSDGLLYPAVCGAGTGAINLFVIHASKLPAAQALGFNPVTTLSEYQDRACE